MKIVPPDTILRRECRLLYGELEEEKAGRAADVRTMSGKIGRLETELAGARIACAFRTMDYRGYRNRDPTSVDLRVNSSTPRG